MATIIDAYKKLQENYNEQLNSFAAAYLLSVGLPPEKVEMMVQTEYGENEYGRYVMTQRIWFQVRKENEQWKSTCELGLYLRK